MNDTCSQCGAAATGQNAEHETTYACGKGAVMVARGLCPVKEREKAAQRNDQVALHGRVVELTSQAMTLMNSVNSAWGLRIVSFRISDRSLLDLDNWAFAPPLDIRFLVDVPDSDGKLMRDLSVIQELVENYDSSYSLFGIPVETEFDIPDGEVRAVIKLWSRGATS